MSDTFITSGDSTPGSTVTEEASTQKGAPASGSETTQDTTGQSDAGGEQSTTEDGQQDQGARRRHTVYDDLRELRAFRREARERESQWQQERQ